MHLVKENGEDTFVVAGKTYKVKDEEKKLDKVNPKQLRKSLMIEKTKTLTMMVM